MTRAPVLSWHDIRAAVADRAQFVLPVLEDVEPGELLRRRAAAPLRPAVDQRPCDVGLFSDERDQADLVDLARHKPAI
jgi:hypothetical protein